MYHNLQPQQPISNEKTDIRGINSTGLLSYLLLHCLKLLLQLLIHEIHENGPVDSLFAKRAYPRSAPQISALKRAITKEAGLSLQATVAIYIGYYSRKLLFCPAVNIPSEHHHHLFLREGNQTVF